MNTLNVLLPLFPTFRIPHRPPGDNPIPNIPPQATPGPQRAITRGKPSAPPAQACWRYKHSRASGLWTVGVRAALGHAGSCQVQVPGPPHACTRGAHPPGMPYTPVVSSRAAAALTTLAKQPSTINFID